LTDNETPVTLRVMLDSRHEQDISPFKRFHTVSGTRLFCGYGELNGRSVQLTQFHLVPM